MTEVRELGRSFAPIEKRKREMEENLFMKLFKLSSESNEGE
jgi:hypothetical protein